ncbi:BTAD domain-containing putative transcriptional regulator [Asanoa sp. WMMD1127]|uniref:AfsR/SARP family transcriptional regulator n=1 Tax=Asanoa sp. WMMD1127 TaxID=3016107 RepID=UPI00241791BE|nr:AfsR/SARP family transcriptional regulator [Asanoa sp. WMMD1127]MDG4820770.1 BTAD domain-containing putative transcriptional regulator [Asanoa sp. WMMD1127]
MHFRILGALEIVRGDQDRTPSTPKLRQVMALLLVRHNRIVRTNELVDELWGEDPPPSALATLQTYIYKLRKLLATDEPGGREELLRTKPHGYYVDLSGQHLDSCLFGQLVDAGRARMEQGDHSETSRLLTEALGIWRGGALADVVHGNVLAAEVTRLEEWRLQALEIRLDADLALGRHRELLGELRTLAAAHPLHEGFQAKLMAALHRSGRRYEALDVYHRLSQLLDAELGLEPSPELLRLHRSLLSPQPLDETSGADAQVVEVAPAGRPLPAPAQLPPGVIDLTGRDAMVARIERSVLGDAAASGIVTITGGAGVGKTALAVHAAHHMGVHFPDGQLFVDLRGSGRAPAEPAQILDQMLRALGVPADQVPATVEERGQLLRTVTARRRVLVVLDDAHSPGQVAPLLPGAGGPAVLITGRGPTVPAAEQVVLDRLEPQHGVELLTRMIGSERVAAEPAAAARIVELCGGLPLALRAVGTRLAATWLWPLHLVAELLADSPHRLRMLRVADIDIRCRFDATLERLDKAERAAFLVLGARLPGEFDAAEAADLLGAGRDDAQALLTGLVDAYLLRPVHSGPPAVRYAFDELVRVYARELLDSAAAPDQPDDAGGVLDTGRPLIGGGLLLVDSGIDGVFRAHRINTDRRPEIVDDSWAAAHRSAANGRLPH